VLFLLLFSSFKKLHESQEVIGNYNDIIKNDRVITENK